MFGWLRKRTPEIDPRRLAEVMGTIVADYGEFLEKTPLAGAVRDEKFLPHNKETILAALTGAIATQDFPAEKRNALADCAMSLAYFQKGVGDHAVHQIGIDITKYDISSMSGQNLAELMLSNPAGKAQYDRLLPLVQTDIHRIALRVEEANRTWLAARNVGTDNP
jgi:hypothetical protein